MEFFSLHEHCCVCEKDTGFNKHKTVHGYICKNCLDILSKSSINLLNIKKYSVTELQNIALPLKKSLSNISDTPTEENSRYEASTDNFFNYDLMDGHQFEHFCAEVLSRNKYENVEVTKGSGDQGIDILATKDGVKYAVQCKCYSSDVGNKAVQEAFSGKTFYNCHVAVVLSNRNFTASAKELAEKNGVLLWDRDKLNYLICKANGLSFSDFQGKYENQKSASSPSQPHYRTETNYNFLVQHPIGTHPKNKWISFFLCLFLGMFGGHKFYEGKIGMGFLYLFTCGLFGFGWIIDIFILLSKNNPYYV